MSSCNYPDCRGAGCVQDPKECQSLPPVRSEPLLACPFCGEKPWMMSMMIACSNPACNAYMQRGRNGDTDEQLVARWNAAPRHANRGAERTEGGAGR